MTNVINEFKNPHAWVIVLVFVTSGLSALTGVVSPAHAAEIASVLSALSLAKKVFFPSVTTA